MGMSFKQIFTEVGQHIQDSSSGRETRIKSAINRSYEEIADGHDWADLYRLETNEVVVTGGENVVYMPAHVDVVKKIILDSNKELLWNASPSQLVKRNYDQLDNSSNPDQYSIMGSSPFKRPIITAETLVFVSSDSSDTTPTVEIWGMVGGEEIHETIQMDGTNNVTSANTFSRITRIGTSSSVEDSSRVGHITVSGTTSSTEYAVIKSHEFDSRYQAIRLQDGASSGTTLTIFYKKKVQKLINDGDSLEIPVGKALFHSATASILDSQGKSAQAREHERKANMSMLLLMSKYSMQAENIFQSNPIGPGRLHRRGIDGQRISVQG